MKTNFKLIILMVFLVSACYMLKDNRHNKKQMGINDERVGNVTSPILVTNYITIAVASFKEQGKNGVLKIYNLEGDLVLENTLNVGDNKFLLSSKLEKGLYQVNATYNKEEN